MGEGQGMQISNALAGQRASKKRAQDDVKLLANRIALLKLEEKKVSHNPVNTHWACSQEPQCVRPIFEFDDL